MRLYPAHRSFGDQVAGPGELALRSGVRAIRRDMARGNDDVAHRSPWRKVYARRRK